MQRYFKRKTDKMDENQKLLVELVCEAVKPKSEGLKLLLERLQRNEAVHGSVLSFAANTWRKKIENKDKNYTNHDNDQPNVIALKRRRWKSSQNTKNLINVEDRNEVHKRKASLEVFRTVAKKVQLLIRVFQRMRDYAVEKGGHGRICSNAMQLKDSVVENREEKDLLFNANDYKIRKQFSVPKWAKLVCLRPAQERTEKDLQNLTRLMKQLKDFRKYSGKMQMLLAKIVRYESFGRRRVVIRKGHLGMGFYIVFSGSVGVVFGEDEDKAFDKEEKPAIIMRKGDSFGELALVRKSVRSATVVCMEYTEFMVIEKEDFFKLGIDKYSQEEMVFRMNYIKSLDLFITWGEEALKEIAEGGRSIEVLSDRVIEEDTTKSDYVYIIVKGYCDVLRLLDLTVLENSMSPWNCVRKNFSTRASTGYSSCLSSKLSKYNSESKIPGYNNTTYKLENEARNAMSHSNEASASYSNESADKSTGIEKELSISPYSSSGFQSIASSHPFSRKFAAASTSPFSSYSGKKSVNSALSQNVSSVQVRRRKPNLEWCIMAMQKKTPKSMPVVYCEENYARLMRNTSLKANLGLGAYVRVNVLGQGDAFGLSYILKEEDRSPDLRKLTLLSSGCEIIRIPKSNIRRFVDDMTLEKIKSNEVIYPSDGDLYKFFKRQHNWRSFREQLVDQITNYQSSIGKSIRERCVPIPRFPRINDKNYSRAESPTEHWRMLAESGQIQNTGPNSPWSVSPIPQENYKNPIDEIAKTSAFKQDRILTAHGSRRTLVLTHGGSRVNRLQASTRSSLLRTKNSIKLAASTCI